MAAASPLLALRSVEMAPDIVTELNRFSMESMTVSVNYGIGPGFSLQCLIIYRRLEMDQSEIARVRLILISADGRWCWIV